MSQHPVSERLEQLNKRKEQALNAGSASARHRQHDRGKMLARERVECLLDPGSFHELDLLARTRLAEATDRPYTDGVFTGWGTVDGRSVASARRVRARRSSSWKEPGSSRYSTRSRA